MKKKKILSLRPSQLAMSLLEVEIKTKEYKKMSPKKLKKTLSEEPVPVVQAPNGDLYLIDNHHKTCALWMAGVKSVYVKVVYRFPKSVSYREFWRRMIKNHWAHPFDTRGNGPVDSLYFPKDIRGIGNDPYRTLAWLCRQHGGYKNSKKTFAEFKWANYFRKKRLLKSSYLTDFRLGLKKALVAARHPDARRLPGYMGKDEI
ncbi:hypothetical protein B9G69_012630 [Bdellovibrio sp. SKB1291214]|uniref:ParB-like protein n=1 Tax=Bdellovibrio sp. SKB1291214 TaxID=1732569 RepID=UPI000B51D184|nr:ParB-like protein [Bdellovibrio sp. SKB1291214]UYL07892.1 hypothetical protein B9G69_012630 [Bdellovibrio sp. SKB1291214]